LDIISTRLLWNLSIVLDSTISKLELPDIVREYSSNSVYIPVKKDKNEEMTSVIEDLKEIISVCKKTKPSKSKNKTVFSLISKCEESVKTFSKIYPQKKIFGNKNALTDHDRTQLLDGLIEDLNSLGDMLYDNTEIILNLESKQNLDVEKKSLKILDKSAKADLEEGLTLLHLGHTTASYMILMRVAEFFVLQYYKKITGVIPKDSDRAWGSMLASLQTDYKSKIDKNFANLLYYLKDKRNEAQHPGKRFNEKDCNKLITYLTEYVDYFAKKK